MSVFLAVAALSGGLLVEGARDHQGHPELSFINDPYFYRAMALSLWTDGADLQSEAAQFAPDIPADEVTRTHEAEPWRYFLHAENGLSHQPPYCYRILVPTVVGWLHELAIPVPTGFLLCYLLGLVLVALAMYALSTPDGRWSLPGLVISLTATAVAAIVILADYVDALYLGLAAVALVAARSDRPWLFITAASLATLARETGIFLAALWILFSMARGASWPRLSLGLVPVAAAAVPHLLVHVPNPNTDLASMASYLVTPERMLTRVAVIGLLVLAVWPRKQYPGFLRAWPVWLIPVVGAFAAVIMAITALSEARTVLLLLPLLIAAGDWGSPWSWREVTAWCAALGIFVGIAYVRWLVTPSALAVSAAAALALVLALRWALIPRRGPAVSEGVSAAP